MAVTFPIWSSKLTVSPGGNMNAQDFHNQSRQNENI